MPAKETEPFISVAEMEKSLEEGDVASTVRSALKWQVPRSGRRFWWMLLAGFSSLVALFYFVGARPRASTYTSQSEALLDTVLNETLGFEKIFVINLKKQTDRRDRVSLAAALTGLNVEYIDAVTTDEVNPKAIPAVLKDFVTDKLSPKVFASWRSHLNAIEAIVEQNLGSALIMEDDADWDVRIHQQMRDWAKTSRQLVQPLASEHDQYLDPTYFKANATKYNQPMPKDQTYTEWDWREPPAPILEPQESAYGDLNRWDLLWLGHCGQRFAKPGSECYKTPLGRVVMPDDDTVAETQYFRNSWSGREYTLLYENHTRVTHWSCAQVCNTAYAISNQGAKKILYDFGVRLFRGMSDAMLREVCDGKDPLELRTCLSVTPPLFNQYTMDRDRHFSHTANIRMSVNGNLEKMVNGQEPTEWFPDETPLEPIFAEEEEQEGGGEAEEEEDDDDNDDETTTTSQ